MSAESVHLSTFGAETETEAEIRGRPLFVTIVNTVPVSDKMLLLIRAGRRTPRTPRPGGGGGRVAQGPHVTYGKKLFLVFLMFSKYL